jgi:hypothetical protein
MAALPKIVEEIVSGVLMVFELFHFMWALLMELLVCFKTFIYSEQLCNNAVNYPSTPLSIYTDRKKLPITVESLRSHSILTM